MDELLSRLVDSSVLKILKARLTPEQIADLVMERINPYWRMPRHRAAEIGGIDETTLRRREDSGKRVNKK